MTSMQTLTGFHTARQEIRRSRFVAIAGPAGTEAEARAMVAAHSDATASHNCWAWRAGQAYRFSDDGEPSGTAGKPILQAIDGQGLDRVMVLVTRWFGGVLLGGGGLMRAYGGTAAMVLRRAPQTTLFETVAAEASCGFHDLALVQSRLEASEAVSIVDRRFDGEGAVFALDIRVGHVEALARLIGDQTGGRAQLRVIDQP